LQEAFPRFRILAILLFLCRARIVIGATLSLRPLGGSASHMRRKRVLRWLCVEHVDDLAQAQMPRPETDFRVGQDDRWRARVRKSCASREHAVLTPHAVGVRFPEPW